MFVGASYNTIQCSFAVHFSESTAQYVLCVVVISIRRLSRGTYRADGAQFLCVGNMAKGVFATDFPWVLNSLKFVLVVGKMLLLAKSHNIAESLNDAWLATVKICQ